MTVPYWGESTLEWDVAIVDRWYFFVRDPDFGAGRKIDVKSAPGVDGASLTDQGYEPTPLKLTLVLFRTGHLEQFAELVERFKPRPGKDGPPPLIISHAALVLFGLSKFAVKRIGAPKSAGPQIKEATLELVEWFPEGKKTGGGKGNGVGKTAKLPDALHSPTFVPGAGVLKPGFLPTPNGLPPTTP